MGQTPIPRVVGHAPPPPPPTALERTKNAYVRGGITIEKFEERLDYLLEHDLTTYREPLPWEVPPKPGGLPAPSGSP